MKRHLILLFSLSILIYAETQAQADLPGDYLPASFHSGRREAFRSLMPLHGIAFIFSYPVRNFSKDVDYEYHPNPDLYYLTGYKEPNAVLVLFKDEQSAQGKSYHELFFVQKRDPLTESWTGKRMGVEGVKSKLGISMTFEGKDFNHFPIDAGSQQKILFARISTDLNDELTDSADLFDLIRQFKIKVGIPEDYDPDLSWQLGFLPYWQRYGTRAIDYLKEMMASNEKFRNNGLISAFVNAKDSLQRDSVVSEAKKLKFAGYDYWNIINKLRGVKTPEEIELIRKSVEISAMAHREAMKAMKPAMSEREIQAVHEFVHKKYGAEEVAYGSIVGSGNNACILHYEDNNVMHVGNKLVLMDVAAEYHGYAADVTRTAPATGKFSREQKLIYDLVYAAQEAIFKRCRAGISFDSVENTSREILATGLLKLGITKKKEEVGIYYPHGCSHHIGLDVHDRGDYDLLVSNMVITVEPGIYIPEGSACDKKWWGIGVRIEDDVLIKDKSYELLSVLAPRKSNDVEKLMTEKSIFKGFELPRLPDRSKGLVITK